MSDQYDEDPSDNQQGNDDFKLLRRKADKADTLEREIAALRRENAFVKAGIPMDDPKLTYFVKGYDGDLDPVAIKQAAVEAGFIAAPQQPVDPAVQQAQQGQAAVLAASTGTNPVFDEDAISMQMEKAYAEGGLTALSDVAQRYGVTFNPPMI